MKMTKFTFYEAAGATASALGLALATGLLFLALANFDLCIPGALLPSIAGEIHDPNDGPFDKTLSALLF